MASNRETHSNGSSVPSKNSSSNSNINTIVFRSPVAFKSFFCIWFLNLSPVMRSVHLFPVLRKLTCRMKICYFTVNIGQPASQVTAALVDPPTSASTPTSLSTPVPVSNSADSQVSVNSSLEKKSINVIPAANIRNFGTKRKASTEVSICTQNSILVSGLGCHDFIDSSL